jgi:formylmethanofuran dehydrogenase subunit E
MKNEYIDPGLNDGLTELANTREQLKRAETYAVTLYEGVIHPLLQCGRKRKKIAKVICSWCGNVMNPSYVTSSGLNSHGICGSCLEKIRAGVPYDKETKTWII